MKYSILSILSVVILLSGCCGGNSDEEYRGIYNYDGKIAFVSDRSGTHQIYTMDIDGSNQTQISQGLNYADGPVWSPNGSKLAFRGTINNHRNIYIVNPDGSSQIQITDLNEVRGYNWSPDGLRIGFFGWDEDIVPRIYIVNSDGSELVSIYSHSFFENCYGEELNSHNFTVDWSPDGTKIVSLFIMDDCYSEVGVMNTNGANLTILTNTNLRNSSPTWSPSGSEILYTNSDGIMKMNADGSDQTNLASIYLGLRTQVPRWSPDGSRIVYNSTIGEVYSGETIMLVMNSDGSNQTNLISDLTGYLSFYSSNPWSPEGSKLLFMCKQVESNNYDIYIMNADGIGKTNLTNNEANDIYFTWQQLPSVNIVFSRFTSEGNNEIYKMNPDGTNQVQLTNGERDRFPVCSPTGSKIAFVRGTTNKGICIMNPDGTEQNMITTDYLNIIGRPVWSCDGLKIAFMTRELDLYEIYTVNVNDSELRKLTDQPGSDGGMPSWSPDGSKIAFFSGRDANTEIYLMNPDGSNQTNISNYSRGADIYPIWSPDGSKIVFESNRDGLLDIFVMNSDGSEQTNLSNNPTSENRLPSWSPDGQKIAFISDRDSNNEIYIVNVDGSGLYNLTNYPGNDGFTSTYIAAPAWSPDGSRIVFSSSRAGGLELYMIYIDGTGLKRLTDTPSGCEDPDWLVIPR